MIETAIYCRLSDEDRNKFKQSDDSESIQNQKAMLIQYAISKGWHIYRIYSDDDYSGLDNERPEWNEMIRDAQKGKFQVILCKSQSRFTRDLEFVEKYLHNKFIEWGIRFIGLVDNADTSIKGNKKQRQILGLTNEWYCEDVSESVRAVFDMKRSKGEFIGSFAAYGYQKDPQNKSRLIIDEQAAEIVKSIFHLYLSGHGTQHIAYLLNQKNIPNPTKYKHEAGLNYVNSSMTNDYGMWNKTTIKRILKNEMYIGNMIQGKRKKTSYKSKIIKSTDQSNWFRVENTHEAIIDKASFYEVQRRIQKRQRSTGEGQAHIFATKVKCADSGNIMHKVTSFHDGTRYYSYLRCKLYATAGSNSNCTSHAIRLDILQGIITERLKDYFNKYVDDAYVFERLQAEENVNKKLNILDPDLANIKKQLQYIVRVLENLYMDRVKGIISEEDFVNLHKSFSEEKESLQKRKADVDKKIDEVNNRIKNNDNWMAVINHYKNFHELTREMVNLFIDYIEVGEKDSVSGEKKVKIHWQF